MKANKEEHNILKYMFSKKMDMSPKTQERLHILDNGGNGPDDKSVVSDASLLYFDVSAITWKEAEYKGLFENLAFKEKTLSYSLAIRDEDKELSVSQGVKIPDTNMILERLKAVLADEYGDSVSAKIINGVAMAGDIEENMNAILVSADDCRQMGILVHIIRIGKKLDIKFYTLFMPKVEGLSVQRQQALSMFNKLSPTIATWESSLKETTLVAIQQLLNTTVSPDNDGNKKGGEQTKEKDDEQIF